MNDTQRRRLVEALHDGPLQIVLAVTGGGVAVINDLLQVPGASRTVLEVVVPYASASLAELVGSEPEQATSEATAVAMAESCRLRARELAPDAVVAGVACTAALVTDRPKRGDHRAHIAVATDDGTSAWYAGFDKGDLDRAGEDRATADVILEALAEAAALEL